MEDIDDYALFKVTRIAKTLFWVNLAPTIVAACVSVYFFLNFLVHPFNESSQSVLPLVIILFIGITAEFIYYRQFTDVDYAQRRFGWIYSIGVNALFALV